MSMWARWWIHNVNILDECHLLKHIAVFVALTRSAVDNGEGQRCVHVEISRVRAWRNSLLISRVDVGKRGTRVSIAFKFDGEKEIGMIDGVIHASVFMEGDCLLGVVSDLISGEFGRGSLRSAIRGATPFVDL